MRKPNIAIIGAGMAGLTSAAILSRFAHVTVYERSDRIGGKVRQTILGNRSIDCGPTVFTLKPLFEKIFKASGAALADHLELSPLEALARHSWEDGSSLTLHADPEKSAEAIERFAGPQDADGYRKFLAQAETTWKTLYDAFIRIPNPSLPGLIFRQGPRRLSKINPYETYWEFLSGLFGDNRLRQLFARYATYCGSSPYLSPATLMLIAHIEQTGVWTVEGGIYAVAKAFQRIAEHNGASFQFNADVINILSDGKYPSAIQTADGQQHDVDAVIFNGDVATLQQGVLGKHIKTSVSAPNREQRTQSAMTWAFCAKRENSGLSTHNVYFSSDYRAEFRNTFEHNQIPVSPTVYVFAPDAEDYSPEDQSDRYFCLVNAPSNGDSKTYTEEESEQCRENMIAHLRKCGLNLEIDLNSLDTTTPTDFAQRFPHTGGALFGKAQHGWRASFQRPGIRTKKRGLYCAGGSVHPGAGIPMTALSGYMAAQSLIRDYALT